MNKFIAYCGLDCSTCEARIATINNDDNLRNEVAKKWSKLNNTLITKEMINCVGCKIEGIKTYFCDTMCTIRKCTIQENVVNCGACSKMDTCDKIKLITSNNKEALERIKSCGK